MKAFLLGFALVGLGCSSREDCDGVYTVGAGFTSAERTMMTSAASRWAVLLGRPVTLTQGPGSACHVQAVSEITDAYVGGMTVGGEEYGHAGNISIASGARSSPELFERVILHELGHGFGLKHVEDPNAVMHIVAGADFTDADLEECRAVGACTN